MRASRRTPRRFATPHATEPAGARCASLAADNGAHHADRVRPCARFGLRPVFSASVSASFRVVCGHLPSSATPRRGRSRWGAPHRGCRRCAPQPPATGLHPCRDAREAASPHHQLSNRHNHRFTFHVRTFHVVTFHALSPLRALFALRGGNVFSGSAGAPARSPGSVALLRAGSSPCPSGAAGNYLCAKSLVSERAIGDDANEDP